MRNEMLAPLKSALRPGLALDRRGAVLIEFLIAFLPVFTFFLCLVQLGFVFMVRLVVEHAAVNAARAAAVVIADDPERYGDSQSDVHRLTLGEGERFEAIEKAAYFSLAPLILNGTLESIALEFPPPDQPAGDNQTDPLTYTPMGESTVQKLRVRVVVDAACKLAIANRITCRNNDLFDFLWANPSNPLRPYPTQQVRAEAVYPYQGARYAYP